MDEMFNKKSWIAPISTLDSGKTISVLLRPNPEGFFVYRELEGIKEERVWKDVTSNSLAGTRTEARAASRTHFYGSGMNVGQRPERTL